MDHIEQTPLRDMEMLFITPCKDFSLPDLCKNSRGTLGKNNFCPETCSSLRFCAKSHASQKIDQGNNYMQSELKLMSPTKLANKNMSLSPWTNRNLYKYELSSKTFLTYSNDNQASKIMSIQAKDNKMGSNNNMVANLPQGKIDFANISEEKLKLARKHDADYLKIKKNYYNGMEYIPGSESKNNGVSNNNIPKSVHPINLITSSQINTSQITIEDKNLLRTQLAASSNIVINKIANELTENKYYNKLKNSNLMTPPNLDSKLRAGPLLRSSLNNYSTNMSDSSKPSVDKLGNIPRDHNMNQNSQRPVYNYSNVLQTPQNNCLQKQDLGDNYDLQRLEGDDDFLLNNMNSNEAKKRRRKSNVQIRILKQELDCDENWSKEKIFKVSKMTGLSESQVYKWCWDQKKKRDDIESKKNKHNFSNNSSTILNDNKYYNSDGEYKYNINVSNFASKLEAVSYKETSKEVYADYFEEDKENFALENQIIPNKPIRKLSNVHGQKSTYSNYREHRGIVNEVKRESLVYKNVFGQNKQFNTSFSNRDNTYHNNDNRQDQSSRSMQRRSLHYR